MTYPDDNLAEEERTRAVQLGMSAKGQKRTSRRLFEHLVGGDQQARRNGEVERLRRSHVDGCFKFCRRLHWEVGGFVATQDTVDIGCRSFRNSVAIVASPRPRVGKTLLARLLTDFHLQEGRSAAAFDLNATGEGTLAHFLPEHRCLHAGRDAALRKRYSRCAPRGFLPCPQQTATQFRLRSRVQSRTGREGNSRTPRKYSED